MTELCALTGPKGARAARGGWRAWLTPRRIRLASGRRLQQPQPFAHRPFGALIALPLEFDAQTGPLVGIDRLQFGPPVPAVGRGWGREQGRIRPANRRDFRHFGPHRLDDGLCRFRSLRRRAADECGRCAKRGREAARDPRSRNMIWHRLVGPNLLTHIGARAADQAGRLCPESLNRTLRIKVNANLPDRCARAIGWRVQEPRWGAGIGWS